MSVGALVDGRYDLLENLSQGTVTAEELQRVVEEFGEPLVLPPLEALETMEVVELDDVDGRACVRLRFALWTKDGPSDLILEQIRLNRAARVMSVVEMRLFRTAEREDD